MVKKKRLETKSRAGLPSERPMKKSVRQRGSISSVKIKLDSGETVTASKAIGGAIMVFIPGGGKRRVSDSERERYLKAFKKKMKEFES